MNILIFRVAGFMVVLNPLLEHFVSHASAGSPPSAAVHALVTTEGRPIY